MSTDCLLHGDSYRTECSATVTGLTESDEIMLDRTVFYAASGGQPGDCGMLLTGSGGTIRIEGANYLDREKTEIAHLPAESGGIVLRAGEPVRTTIDWVLRYSRRRSTTSL